MDIACVCLLFDAAPAIPWRLVGGAAHVLRGTRSTCRDLDVNVPAHAFDAAVARLRDSGRGLRILLCRGCCAWIDDSPIRPSPQVNIDQIHREVARARIGGVPIDLSVAPAGLGPRPDHHLLGSYAIPLAA